MTIGHELGTGYGEVFEKDGKLLVDIYGNNSTDRKFKAEAAFIRYTKRIGHFGDLVISRGLDKQEEPQKVERFEYTGPR